MIKILCPVDFSPPSDAALQYAASIARRDQGMLHIVHIVPPALAVPGLSEDVGKIVAAAHRDSEERLAILLDKVKQAGISASTEVRFGEVDQQILNAITELKADLLVVGTHGRRGFEHWLLGSVCERLLRIAPVPMLTVRRGRKSGRLPEIKKVLIGVDFSEQSERLLAGALPIARAFEARVMLLHVAGFTMGSIDQEYRRPLIEGIRSDLDAMIPGEFRDALTIGSRVEFGAPYRVILRVAEEIGADLIAIGTHGHSALDRFLVGTNADRIIRGASMPVFAIPPAAAESRRRARSGNRRPAASDPTR